MSDEGNPDNSPRQSEHAYYRNLPNHGYSDGSYVACSAQLNSIQQQQRERDEKSKEFAERIVNQKWFSIYWVLFLVLCVLLIESFFMSGIALGTVIWFALTEVIVITFAKYSTGKLNKKAALLCIPIGLINIGHLLFYSVSIQIITWPVALMLLALQLTYLSKPEKDKVTELFDLKNTFDVLNTIFVKAFVYIPYPFKGLLKFAKKKNMSIVGHVAIGILIALPIAVIFIGLFSSADESFSMFLGNIVETVFIDFNSVFIVNVIIGAIMCIFLSAAFVGANAQELKPQPSEKPVKEVNNVTLGTILVIIAVVVAMYACLQFNHWFGNVPQNYYQIDEYSDSARAGFFELIAASCILLALITTVTIISTKRDNKLAPLIKAPLLLLCACNFIVLCSAVERIGIYIGRSGITSNRVLALWFIAVIVICMAGIIIKIIRFSLKTFGYCCVMVIALVCALSFCDMDYYVAENHIYLAEHHLIQNLEADMLSGLSYAATKPLVEYKDRIENGESAFPSTKKQRRSDVLNIINKELARHKNVADRLSRENPIMGFNFSRLIAQNALALFDEYNWDGLTPKLDDTHTPGLNN